MPGFAFTMFGPGMEIEPAREDPLMRRQREASTRRRDRGGGFDSAACGARSPAESEFEEHFRIYFEPGAEALCMFYRDRTLAL
jgi:hypothetical protein